MLKHKIAVGLLLGVSVSLLGGGTQLTPAVNAKSTAKITQLRARYAGLQHRVYDQNDS